MSTPYFRDIIVDTVATDKIGSKVAGGTLTLGSAYGKLAVSNASTVTQLTSIVTGVALTNGNSGVITTFAASALANATHTFTVTHPSCLTTSIVLVNVVSYTGTGLPNVIVNNRLGGSFDIIIQNLAGVDALNAAMRIGFLILN